MNGEKLDDQGRSWSAETLAKPLAVRGAWPLQHSPPIVWADAAGRPDVKDLARAHHEASEGEVETQWCARLATSMDVLLLLLVRFKKPVRTEFALAFEPRHFGALLNAAPAGSVSMVTREPRVGNGAIEGRNAVIWRSTRLDCWKH